MLRATTPVTAALALTGVAASAPARAQGVTLQFWDNQQSESGLSQYQKEAVERFEAENPGIKVNVVTVPYPEYQQRLLTAVQGGNAPDVSTVDQIWNAAFAEAGAIEPLDDLAEQAGIKPDDFFKGAWESANYGGKLWGIPFNVGVWYFMFYNKKLFAEAGVDPASATTWDGRIGLATAKALAASGAAVTIADIDADLGEQAAREIAASGGRARFVRTDVTLLADVQAATEQTLAAFGSVDILVNNAARAIGGVVDETDEETWNTVLSTNLTSVWRGMKCVVPHMRRQRRGAIVNLSSVQSLTGFHGWAAYAAAKGGINALTQQTALDLAPHGIRVNAVAPGTIMTPMNERIFRDLADPRELIERWNAAHPIGRFGQPEEVAQAVLFLASDRAAFITGTLLKVDGGLTIKGG